jgi:HAMP domain-containing protein
MSLLSTYRSNLGVNIAAKLAVWLGALALVAAVVMSIWQSSVLDSMIRDKGRLAASAGAYQYGGILDRFVDSGLLTVDEVFDRDYQEIKGFHWGKHPKYHTKYDSVTDQAVLAFQDQFLDNEDFVSAFGVDVNGYVPTHNTAFSQPLTGDAQKDDAGNITKRKLDDLVGLSAAHNKLPTLVQTYSREDGVTVWDFSSPIEVKGRHWGAFRVAISSERVASIKLRSILWLFALFSLLGLISILVSYSLISRAMGPVALLTSAADQISLGEELDTPLRSESPDEIGRLTRAVDRLRESMKAALSRLE